MTDKTKNESSGKYVTEEIPTATATVFKDSESGETLNGEELLLRIANSVEELKRQLIG